MTTSELCFTVYNSFQACLLVLVGYLEELDDFIAHSQSNK